MKMTAGQGPRAWVETHCPSFDGQFLFLDPLDWQTHLLTEGAVVILREAATAIEAGQFDSFLAEVGEAGGWPPGLQSLIHSLTTLTGPADPPAVQE